MWIFETIKIVLRNVELEKMTTIKIVPIAGIGPPEAALKLRRPGVTRLLRVIPAGGSQRSAQIVFSIL